MSDLVDNIAAFFPINETGREARAEEIISLIEEDVVERVNKNTTRLAICECEDGIYEDTHGSYVEYRLVIKAIRSTGKGGE